MEMYSLSRMSKYYFCDDIFSITYQGHLFLSFFLFTSKNKFFFKKSLNELQEIIRFLASKTSIN